ncbi:hypothetical protein CEV31_0399 [Brucella thiophenivorans]|uniref:Uncharacterized protein n=1 Tax=Brucella thiophenivorans TaxID=571255 RepID=A0A256G525_9HYPH|nr:hypothetical protein CEV31_0399 [Brucella thiophenivorans]
MHSCVVSRCRPARVFGLSVMRHVSMFKPLKAEQLENRCFRGHICAKKQRGLNFPP